MRCEDFVFVYFLTLIVAVYFCVLVINMAGSNDQSDDVSHHQDFAIQAVTQNIMRLLDQRLEPFVVSDGQN